MSFSFASCIAKYLSLESDKIFDEIIKDIEIYASQPVTGMLQLRNRNSNQTKGRLWEDFVCKWLIVTGKCSEVWKIADLPDDLAKELKLSKTQDSGIDLVGCIRYHNTQKYVAIQCKYRGPNAKSVTYVKGRRIITSATIQWANIATFIGLCAQTGPWHQHWIVTNCRGIGRRKVPRTNKDYSICLKTFQSTSKEHWIELYKTFSNNHEEKKIGEQLIEDSAKQETKELSVEELRLARLSFFDNKLKII